MTEQKRNKLRRKLQEARYRLLTRAPELAYPLKEMLFVAVKDVYHISTNGSCVYFDAAWLEKLSEWSLDYALSHQLMHLKLGHLQRSRLYKGERYHYACNIIVNSHLVEYGFTEDKLPGIGELRRETLLPRSPGSAVSPMEAYRMCPFDPATLSPAKLGRIRIDTDLWWDVPGDRGESGTVVLSPEDPDPEDLIPSARILGELEYYRRRRQAEHWPELSGFEESDAEEDGDLTDFDTEYTEGPPADWKETVRSLRGIRERDQEAGSEDAMRERLLRRTRVIPRDWRTVLNRFIMEETRDYSFTPPDRRLQDLELFLPDFNADVTQRLRVLFMVDISTSLREDEVGMAAEELSAAMEQFGGLLEGSVAFFDTEVRRVVPLRRFGSMEEHIPGCGGGTDFSCIFRFVSREMRDTPPSEIVIMTDGKADFPDFSESMGIPVLWLLTSDRVRVPWGQAACFRRA